MIQAVHVGPQDRRVLPFCVPFQAVDLFGELLQGIAEGLARIGFADLLHRVFHLRDGFAHRLEIDPVAGRKDLEVDELEFQPGHFLAEGNVNLRRNGLMPCAVKVIS